MMSAQSKKDEVLHILETFLTDEQLERLKRVSDMTSALISTRIRIPTRTLHVAAGLISTTDVTYRASDRY